MTARTLLAVGIAAAVALVLPTADVAWFSGVPLNGPTEVVALLALVPLLAVRSVRRVIRAECGPLVSRRAGRVAVVLVAIAVAAKLGLALVGDEVGWHGCYRAIDDPTPPGACERSYDTLLAGDSVTRYDTRLDFQQTDGSGPSTHLSTSNWGLAFFNSLRWNVADPPGYRDALPFAVEWTADADAGGEVEVTYVGEGEIAIGGETRRLAPSYGRARTVVLRGLEGTGPAVVEFAFEPPDGPAGIPPYATLRVSGLDPAGPTTVQSILGVAVDLTLLALLVALLLCYAVLARRLPLHWVPALALALVLALPAGDPRSVAIRTTFAVLVIVAALLLRPSLRSLLFASFAIVGIEAIAIGHTFAAWDSVLYRTAGNDPLTYESFAREILASGSLRAGEDVFFYQPAFRYILFAARSVLGDTDAVLSLVSMSAVSIGIVFAVGAACSLAIRRPIGRVGCFAAAACVIVPLNANLEVIAFVEVGISEWVTWAAIPVGVAMVALAPSRRWVVIGVALLAACIVVRTNLALALVVASAAGVALLWRTDRRGALGAVAAFGAIACLPLVHNLIFGGEFVLGATSSDVNVYLPLGDIPRAIWDSDVRSMLERQVRVMLYASPEASSDAILVGFRVLQAAWLLATIAVLVRWRRTTLAAKALMLTPALALVPLVVYEAIPYYPRHVVAGHILMATVVAVVALPSFTRRRRRFDVLVYAPWAGPLLGPGAQLATGGMETQGILFARALAARGHSVALLVRDTEEGLPESVDGMSVLAVGLTRGGRRDGPMWTPRYVLSLIAALARAPADSVIQFSAGVETGAVGALTRAAGHRFVYLSASMVDFELERWGASRLDRAGFALGMRLADEIVVQTAEEGELCRTRFGRDSVLIRSVTEVAERRAGETDSVLWVGRMVDFKRPAEFLALAQALPEIRFRMVAVPGALDERALRERAARLPNVEWLGPRSRTQLMDLMERAVALVSTSDVEGMPNVFLEAWARGVPTLSLDIDPDGVIEKEQLGFVAHGDRRVLIDRTAELWLDSDLRATISARCLAYVRREHDIGGAVVRLERTLGLQRPSATATPNPDSP